MFDNLPFTVTDKKQIENFLSSGLLERVSESIDYCMETGEQYTIKRIYKFYNLYFSLTYSSKDVYDTLICKGSFHYLMNKGKHNANKINFAQAKIFLLQFASLFKVDLFKLKLRPPEFGLNITIPFDVVEVVQHAFCEQRKEFSFNPPHIKTSKISGSPANESRLKFYSKYHDCPKYAEKDLLRAELQFKKIRWLHSVDVFSIGDLLNVDNLKKISKKHIEMFEHIIVYDYTINPPNNQRVKDKLRDYKSERYWRKLIQDCKQGKCYKDKYNDKKEDLNKLSKKYGSDLTHKILEIIRKQWVWFFEKEKHPNYAPVFKPNYAPFIECITTTPTKKCLVTGLDISMQKKDSYLLSHTGLKYLYVTNRPLYDNIKKKYLSILWVKVDLNVEIREIAHNIRNAHNNQRIKQQRLYPKHQLSLLHSLQ
jgi:hypothetical protein